MRILTVRQPWAWAIIHGGKNVENRVRNIAGDYRGPVLIHVAQKPAGIRLDQYMQVEAAGYDTEGEPANAGHIIGVVDLVDVHVARATASGTLVDWARGTKPGELCSPWAEWGGYHLVLSNPRALDEPIPYKGALGLRKTEFAVVNDYLVAPWGHGPGSCTPYGCEPWCDFEPVARLVSP